MDYPKPVKFSQSDAIAFVAANNIDLASLPKTGRVYTAGDRSILVWVTPAGVLEVIDMTGHPAVNSINQAEYHTADESFTHNVMETLWGLAKEFPDPNDLTSLLAVGLVLGVAILVAK